MAKIKYFLVLAKKSKRRAVDMPNKRIALLILLAFVVAIPVHAVPINVAEGASVTLNGVYGVLRPASGWDPNPVAAASTLTDGALLPSATVWNDGSVWWDAAEPTGSSAANTIEIDFAQTFELFGLKVQADDNDTYRIEYWDGSSWITAWDIPAVGGFGMQTRPDPSDATSIFELASIITTDRLRFTGTGGDSFFSVSEIQAFVQAPAPSTPVMLAALGLAVCLLNAFQRRATPH